MKVKAYSVLSFLFFLFRIRCNGKKNTWMRMNFVTVMVIISEMPFWKLLDISYFQSSQQLRNALTKAFERHLTVEDFTDMDQHKCQFFLGQISWNENGQRCLGIIRCIKVRACYILLFLWNKPSFQIQSSVDRIIFTEFVYLFTFWYSVYLGLHPAPLSFFHKNQ